MVKQKDQNQGGSSTWLQSKWVNLVQIVTSPFDTCHHEYFFDCNQRWNLKELQKRDAILWNSSHWNYNWQFRILFSPELDYEQYVRAPMDFSYWNLAIPDFTMRKGALIDISTKRCLVSTILLWGSINQSINQSISQSNNQSINQINWQNTN